MWNPGSFHTTESLLTQKNRRRKRTVQWMDERQKQWKKFHKRLYIYREGIKPKNMESDSIQTNSLRLNRKKVIGGGGKIWKNLQTNIWSNLCGLLGLGYGGTVMWGVKWGGGCNAPRTVGTLGRSELSPPIMIIAWTQKGGGRRG